VENLAENKARNDMLIAKVKQMQRMAKLTLTDQFTSKELRDPGQVIFKRRIPVQRGKYRLLPPGVEDHVDD
jgi:hypothetical protein